MFFVATNAIILVFLIVSDFQKVKSEEVLRHRFRLNAPSATPALSRARTEKQFAVGERKESFAFAIMVNALFLTLSFVAGCCRSLIASIKANIVGLTECVGKPFEKDQITQRYGSGLVIKIKNGTKESLWIF
jgi:hypothetical protein